MILLIRRNPTSYFRRYRNYFVIIYSAFFAFPIRELMVFYSTDQTLLRALSQLMVAAAITIALLWGHLATRLYLYPETFPLRSLLSKPNRPIHWFFIIYLIPMAMVPTAMLVLPGAINVDPNNMATYLLSGVNSRSIGYGAGFLGLASTVIIAFVVYPFTVLVRLRSQLKDVEVRSALKVIASSFGAISALLLMVNALESFGLSVIGLGHVVVVSLLILVVHAFSKPSFLKAFLGVVPSLEVFPGAKRSDQRILFYESDEEKLVPVSHYVSEGVNQQGRVLYFYNGDEVNIREGLAKNGIYTRQHATRGNLRLSPLSSLYQSEGMMDEEAAIASCMELVAEARALGKKGLRIVIDYGEYAKRPLRKFVEHLSDPRWTTLDHYVNVLMLFARSAFQGQEAALDLLRSRVPTMDLSDSLDTFSRTVGLSHSEIVGKKILLEYEPSSDYDRILKSLLVESSSNFERIVFFTRRDSPVISFVGDEPGLKMFILTSQVSYPKVEGENRVLLPAYDSSLLLDALNRTIEAYGGASFTIVFDNISHYVFTLGPDRTLALVRQALELMISDKVTAIFLLNFGAHDPKIIFGFENLFDIELLCIAGARVPEVRKRLSLSVQ